MKKLKSWKKSFKTSLFTTFKEDNDNLKKRWKNETTLKTTNKSTISLHIGAYENSIESDLFHNENIEGLKKEKFGLIKTSKRSFIDDFKSQDPFEFPRQQDGGQKNEPEVMQFKATKKLQGTNRKPSSSQQIEHEDKKTNSKPSSLALLPLSKRPSAADIEHCEDSEECETWWDFFKMFDTNHDGMIPVNDLKAAVAKNRHFFHISTDEVHKMIEECDKNGDEMIDFPEFCEIMCKTKKQRVKQVTIAMGNAVLPKSRQAEATSYLVEYTCWPPPLFITLISILEVTMYFYFAVGTEEGIQSDRAPPIDSPFALSPHLKFEVWRYFTYVFTHNGYMHLIPNIIMQLLLGISLELVHKGLRIAAIYFIGAFTGALLFFCFDPTVYLVGASGGVYSLITAHLADVFLNWSEMPFRWVRIVLFSVWVIADFGFALYSRFFACDTRKVAVMGHLGGAIAGLFLGILVLRNLEKKKCERVVWWISLVVFTTFVIGCIIFIVADTKDHGEEREKKCEN
uniref:EF-hand domain-containing protein n=1 Tax=Panagrolaimus sp. PS1159 TaxID=55785 RepID=A0AC35G1E8_9BILA